MTKQQFIDLFKSCTIEGKDLLLSSIYNSVVQNEIIFDENQQDEDILTELAKESAPITSEELISTQALARCSSFLRASVVQPPKSIDFVLSRRDIIGNQLWQITICETSKSSTKFIDEIQNSKGFILVYSVSSRATFEKISDYYNSIIQIKVDISSKGVIPMVLVGLDKGKKAREVSFEEGVSLSEHLCIPFFEMKISQMHNEDMEDLSLRVFTSLCELITVANKISNSNTEQHERPRSNSIFKFVKSRSER